MAYNEKNNGNLDTQSRLSAVDASASAERGSVIALHETGSGWLERVDSEVDRLRERSGEAGDQPDVEAHNRELERENAQLRADLSGLQMYIDGRKDRWTEMQQRLEHYEDALAGMEQVVRDAEDKLASKDDERAALSNRIIELERRCAELAGRLKERDRGSRGDQRLDRLEQALAERDSESEAAVRDLRRQLERALHERHALEARAHEAEQQLEALARRRSGSSEEVRSLRQELVAQQNLIGKLEAEVDAKQETIDALQRERSASAADRNIVSAAGDDGGASVHADARRESTENVEIIHIGDLFRHGVQSARAPLALLEADDGTTYPVTKASVTIGRSASNDICIRREFVSRVHARLTLRGIGAIIEDAGSKNGILVNSEPVERRVLVDGDIVSLGGKLDLKYVDVEGSARAGAPVREPNE